MEKCRVTGVVVDASGVALANASVRFRLTRREKDIENPPARDDRRRARSRVGLGDEVYPQTLNFRH
jgi:hypothetical protein